MMCLITHDQCRWREIRKPAHERLNAGHRYRLIRMAIDATTPGISGRDDIRRDIEILERIDDLFDQLDAVTHDQDAASTAFGGVGDGGERNGLAAARTQDIQGRLESGRKGFADLVLAFVLIGAQSYQNCGFGAIAARSWSLACSVNRSHWTFMFSCG